jgi:glycosyltransferase involved in cell wall biosynthesis
MGAKSHQIHVNQLLKSLIKQTNDHDFYLVLNGSETVAIDDILVEFYGLVPRSNIRLWQQPVQNSIDIKLSPWQKNASQSIRGAFVLSLNPDVVCKSAPIDSLDQGMISGDAWLHGHNIPVVNLLDHYSSDQDKENSTLDSLVQLVNSLPEANKYDQKSSEDKGWSKAIYQSLITNVASRAFGKPKDAELILCAKAIADTFPEKCTLSRLFVDISELAKQDFKTGIQRVTRSVLLELLTDPPAGYQVEPVYAGFDKAGYRFARKFTQNMLGKENADIEDEVIDPQPGDIFLGLDLQHHVALIQSEYLQNMRRMGVYVYFVVYDLLPIHFPQFWPAADKVHEVHESWLKSITKLDGAICISNAVADELAIWTKDESSANPHFQISWFHLGADLQNSLPSFGLPSDAEHVLRVIERRNSFLMVGTIEPRKGCLQVLEAFELLWREGQDVNLVFVGKKGWMVDALCALLEAHPELGKRLFWLRGVSDEYLDRVYKACTCLIAASEGEGFGLPLIEAAQHHLPIIARNLPVFKEVAGSGAYYFDGLSATDLSNAIQRWLALKAENKAPLSQNIQWKTWKDSAKMIWGRIQEMSR